MSLLYYRVCTTSVIFETSIFSCGALEMLIVGATLETEIFGGCLIMLEFLSAIYCGETPITGLIIGAFSPLTLMFKLPVGI